MKGSYLLCPQKHALKSSPSVNTSSPNRDFFHNTFFQSRRNCLHPCCCLVWLASTYISAWSLCCGSFHLHQFKQENNIGMQKNGCQSYLLIRLGSLYIRQVTCKCCTCSLTFLFNRFPTTNDSRDVIGAYNIAFEPHNFESEAVSNPMSNTYLNQALFLVMNGTHLLFQLWYCFQFILWNQGIRWNVSNVCICMEITALFHSKHPKKGRSYDHIYLSSHSTPLPL